MQKINGTPGKLKRKRMIDGKLSAVADATRRGLGAAASGLGIAASVTGEGLKKAASATGEGLKKAGEGLVSLGSKAKKKFLEARARNRTRRRYGQTGENRSGRATRRNRDYECDEECRARVAMVENITFLIKSTPGIKPGYTIDIIRQPNGSSASQMVGLMAGIGATSDEDAIAYPPVANLAVEIEGEVIDNVDAIAYPPEIAQVVVEIDGEIEGEY